MKLPNLSCWSSDSKIEGLLFFAQILDEMLFHFTIDSYKPKIYNTHGSLIELKIALNNVKSFRFGKNGIKDYIKPMCDELSNKISADVVARMIIIDIYGDEGFKMIQHNITNWSNLDDYILFIGSLENIFTKKYLAAVKKELSTEIEKSINYNIIRDLADSYVSELLMKGFSQEYLYYSTQSYFFQENQFMDVNSVHEYLEGFFTLFPDEAKNWNVVFRVSKEFRYIPKYSNSETFTLHKEQMEPKSTNHDERRYINQRPNHIKQKYPDFLVAKDFPALDPYAAKNSVKTLLDFYNNILTLSTYYRRLKWDDIALVYSEDAFPTVTRRSVSPLAKNKKFERYIPSGIRSQENRGFSYRSRRHPRHRREQYLNADDIDLSDICRNKEKILFEKLNISGYSLFRALSLYGSAINSRNPINQYLNIWIALETLLPQGKGKTIAKNIGDAYLPILNKKYVNKLIESFQYDLEHYLTSRGSGDVDEFFSDFPEELNSLPNTFLRCSALLTVNDENLDLIEKAKQKIGRNPLLIYRMEELNGKFSRAASIQNTIRSHEQRMKWHLLRLFRIRNRLTHQGEQINVLDRLLENINFYFHTAMEEIEDTLDKHGHVDSLDKAFMWINLEHETHMKILQNNKNNSCNYGNFEKLLFGRV